MNKIILDACKTKSEMVIALQVVTLIMTQAKLEDVKEEEQEEFDRNTREMVDGALSFYRSLPD